MEALLESLGQLFEALWNVFVSLLVIARPFIPVAAWVAFWMFAVNWVDLFKLLLGKGAILGVVLIWLVTILVWGTVAPPADGSHYILGLTVGNFVGKFVYTTTLFVIAALCGSVQLTGVLGDCCRFEEQPQESPGH